MSLGSPSTRLLIISIFSFSSQFVIAYPPSFIDRLLQNISSQNVPVPFATSSQYQAYPQGSYYNQNSLLSPFPTSAPYINPTVVQKPSPALLRPLGESFVFPVGQQLKKRFYTPPSNPNLVVDYLGYWFVNCTIGGQILNPILDTGSADM